MVYKIETKNNVINRIMNGEKAKTVSEETGISLSTIYKWKKSAENEKNVNEQEKEASKEVCRLIKLKKFSEAHTFTEKYPLNPVIQSQRITIYIEIGEYEKAKEIGNRPEFIDDPIIQSQMITIAIIEKDYKKAEEIGNKQEFIDNPTIQSQMITIALIKKDYEKAEKIVNRPEFIKASIIQSQMIKILIKKENYEKAKEIGNRPEFINDPAIQSQMITIAIIEKDCKRAKEIGNRPEFIDYEPIKWQMMKIEIEEMRIKFLNRIKTKMYYNKLENSDIEEIKQNNRITKKEKLYILLAIYEKQKNINEARRMVKEYRNNNEEVEVDTNINIIMQRIENKKKKIFDWSFYDNLLQWKIDEKLDERVDENVDKQADKKTNEITTYSKPNNMVTNRNTEKNQIKSKNDKRQVKTKNKNKSEKFRQQIKVKELNKKSKEKNHYDEMMQYLEEKRKEIYVKMQSTDTNLQKNATIEWHKMEKLIEKTKQNRDNKEYINKLYEKISILRRKEKELLDKGR